MSTKKHFRNAGRSRACAAILAVFGLAAAAAGDAWSAQILYVEDGSRNSYARHQMETAVEFYGLKMRVVNHADINATSDRNNLALVIPAEALAQVSRKALLDTLKKNGRTLPVIIVGISERTPASLLEAWSGGAIRDCQKSANEGSGSFRISKVADVALQLGGHTLPMTEREIRYMSLDKSGAAQVIVTAEVAGNRLPIFARVEREGQQVFFATEAERRDVPASVDPYREQAVFATLARELMFVRYAGGDRAWHSPASYANLTIDDAWLRAQYGYVDYEALLREAMQHNFHATIAFVPWNFDRSEPKVVSLFREHPDRLSITVHGNNHDHQEFGPLQSHPLNRQVGDIKQGLARMEKFSQLTGIPYSAVMVFPHSISPEGTLGALKRYNFLATTNSTNVPSDARAPEDTEFALRGVTEQFANFPSVRRYSAEAPIPESQLAIDAFIGNPMLFYVHQGFFAEGIDAFDKIADTVKQIEPSVRWRNLSDVVEHLYLSKLRDDGDYDVHLNAASAELHNSGDRKARFYIEKEEDFSFPLEVLVDGNSTPYERDAKQLRLSLEIPAGATRKINIKYSNDLNLAMTDISKSSLRIQMIRELSDFRDDVVAKSAVGRWFVRSYAKKELYWNGLALLLIGLFIIPAAAGWFRAGRKSEFRTKSERISASQPNLG